MFRTPKQPRPRARELHRLTALVVGAALSLAPWTPAHALRVAPPPPPPAAPSAAPSATPSAAPSATEAPAGDENIQAEPLEPGQLGPADKDGAAASSKGRVVSTAPQIKGSLEQGFAVSDEADLEFDAGNYGEAARLYGKALELLSENESNHVTRAVILANGVNALEQLYATSHEVEYLRKAQRMLQDYLRACKSKWGNGCERHPETQESRARLQEINAAIEVAVPMRAKIPPEIGVAPGGKPYDLTVKLPPAPAWIAPTMVGGFLLAGGGAALAYYGATADKYGPIYKREGEFGDTTGDTTGDTGDTGDTDGTDTGGATGGGTSLSATELSPDAKGKILIGLGAFLAAAGVGVVVLGALRLAKHRRINRERMRTLAITPTFGRGTGGLALSGRF